MRIYKIPKNRRYWVVRSQAGIYFDHFTNYGVVAIGHLDKLGLRYPDTSAFNPDLLELKDAIKQKTSSSDSVNKSVTTSFNQIRNFLYEMKVGDWVITLGRQGLRFGLITGMPLVSSKPIVQYYGEDRARSVEMKHSLRRDVLWGPFISRRSMSYGLISSLRANQTLFNVDKHTDAIYHALYPAFRNEDSLHLSLKITSTHDISNYSVVKILSFLNELEVIVKELDKGALAGQFESAFTNYARADAFGFTTKAQFSSPGEIWAKITTLAKMPITLRQIVLLTLGYSMLFGGSTGMVEFDGILDLETRQRIWSLILERINSNELEDAIKSLNLDTPHSNTSELESLDSHDGRSIFI